MQHLVFAQRPNWLVKPTPTSSACGCPPCFALRRGLPRALDIAIRGGILTNQEVEICEAWREASRELGVRFTSPFDAVTSTGRLSFLGLIHGFGRKEGTLVCLRGREPRSLGDLDLDRFFVSVLYEGYRRYDRQLFVDTLNDWQWCGEGQPPSWYSGQPWC